MIVGMLLRALLGDINKLLSIKIVTTIWAVVILPATISVKTAAGYSCAHIPLSLPQQT